MTATWYRLSIGEITPVEVVRRTEKTVTVRLSMNHRGVALDREYRINSQFSAFFPTWQQAHDELARLTTQSLNAARAYVAELESDLAKVMAMTPTAKPE
jgi:phage major head subunit gpT-like protein